MLRCMLDLGLAGPDVPRGDSSCGQCDGSTADFSRAGQAVYAQSALQLLPELHASALLRTKVGADMRVQDASPSANGFRFPHQEGSGEGNLPRVLA
jgi:hypothetical protein